MSPIDILRRMTKPLTDEQVEQQLIARHGALGRGNASEDMAIEEASSQASLEPIARQDPGPT